jgi:dTMP kinase
VLLTHEPGGTPLGEALRRWLKGHKNFSPLAELSLFIAARAQLINEVVRPALEAGVTVIADRYVASTVAYQGYGRGLDLDLILTLNQAATDGLTPDLTVLLDLPPKVALDRKDSPLADAFEAAPSEFHRRVREGYFAQAIQEQQSWLKLDATQPQKALARQIWANVQPLL